MGSASSTEKEHLSQCPPCELPAEIAKLAASLQGSVYQYGSPGYAAERRAWNRDSVGWPSAIVSVASVQDVQQTVMFAAKHRLKLGVAGGRHSCMCMVSDAFVIDLSALHTVDVDAEHRTVTVGGGAKLGHVDAVCEPYGLAIVAGHNPDTGVGGLTLGGGVGYLSRAYGLAIDNLLRAQIVLANGETVWASDQENCDLFWAIRGGGGNFGVVTSFVFRAHPLDHPVLGGDLVYLNLPWPLNNLLERPLAVAKKMRDYATSCPREQAITLVFPCGGPLVTSMVHHGDNADHELATVKGIAWTPLCTVKRQSYHTGVQRMTEHLQQSGNYFTRGEMMDDVSDAALEALWKLTHEDIPNTHCVILLIQIGGKQNEVRADATAFPTRNSTYWLLTMGHWKKDHEKDTVLSWCRRVQRTVEPFRSAFYAPVLDEDQSMSTQVKARLTYGSNMERLEQIKHRYDPSNLFRLNGNIEPRINA